MAIIVAVDAGAVGDLLCEIWSRLGHHSVATSFDDPDEPGVVLFGGDDAAALRKRITPRTLVIDCGNPSDRAALRAGPSRAEAIATALGGARVVKAFNTIPLEALAYIAKHNAPEVRGVYPSGFYCGDDEEAKRVVAGLIAETSLDPIDCGPLANASLLESLAFLVDDLAHGAIGDEFAFALVRPPHDRSPLDPWM